MTEWNSPFALAGHVRRPRILLVDDQPMIIRTLHALFAADHEVFMATSGQQALELSRKIQPDLVLLDLEMPDMDGTEVSREMKLVPELHDIPIIFVTGHSGAEAETRCWDAGGVDFITKPFIATTVKSRVKVHLALKFQTDVLRQMAFIDGLTMVANRRFFDERLEQEWRRHLRSNLALSLLMVDVDYFKRYNDYYGHQAGDNCLRQIALCLKHTLNRPFDLVARYGGEEFVCLLPETGHDAATGLACKVEAAVRQLQMAHAKSECAEIVTISVGVATANDNQLINSTSKQECSVVALVQLADQCLYAAKHAGRGRAWSATPP